MYISCLVIILHSKHFGTGKPHMVSVVTKAESLKVVIVKICH